MKNSLETRLGIFVALAVIAAIVIIEMIGDVDIFQRGYHVHALFDTVQERLGQNKQRYLRPAIQHLLGGMLRCGECGSAMYSYDHDQGAQARRPSRGCVQLHLAGTGTGAL